MSVGLIFGMIVTFAGGRAGRRRTLHVVVADLVAPFRPVARTVKVCAPSSRSDRTSGDAQGANAAESSEHVKLTPSVSETHAKAASGRESAGGVSVNLTVGAARTVHEKLVLPVAPFVLRARTTSRCSPGASSETANGLSHASKAPSSSEQL